jgi:branched-chain amino acid transport system ATP-binding protein
LAAGYAGHPIVSDLNLQVARGDVVALLGANGAGKTTALLTLAGHLPPLAGEVHFDGHHVTASLHWRARAGLAYVPEGRSVFRRLSTAQNLRVARGDPAIALELFPELRPLLKRPAGLLSGGEQQMLTLGRALSRLPKLLLADELSLGLAPLLVERLLAAVREVADKAGTGVLLVEQHAQRALAYADRAYVMRRGAVVLSGSADEVAPRLEEAYLTGDHAASASETER